MKSFISLLNCIIVMALIFLSGPLMAVSYYQLRIGGGIAGGDDTMNGANYDRLPIRGPQGPALGGLLGFSYMNTLSSSSSIVVNGTLTFVLSDSQVSDEELPYGETPPPLQEKFKTLWHFDEFNISYAHSLTKSFSFTIGPHFLMAMGSGEYPYEGAHEGYPDKYSCTGLYAGAAAGISSRVHMFRGLFFLPKFGSGLVGGMLSESYDSEKSSKNEALILLNSTIGFGYYLINSQTMFEFGANSSFYMKSVSLPDFFERVRYARIIAYTSFTKNL